MSRACTETTLLRCSYEDSRSASAFSQGLSLAPAFLAAALYRSRSPGVTRTFIRTLAGSFSGGLPLGRLALVMG
jgi:hypothetical protein